MMMMICPVEYTPEALAEARGGEVAHLMELVETEETLNYGASRRNAHGLGRGAQHAKRKLPRRQSVNGIHRRRDKHWNW